MQGDTSYHKLVQTNNVAHGWLDKKLDTKKLASRFKGGMFAGSKTAGLKLALLYPKCTATIQRTGRMHIMAARSKEETALAIVKIVASFRAQGIDVDLSQDGHVINNVVCSARTWALNLVKMQKFAPHAVEYGPVFPAAAMLNVKQLGYPEPTRVKIESYQSGMLNLTGAKSYEESMDVLKYCVENIYRHVKVSDSTTTDVEIIENPPLLLAPVEELIDYEAADDEIKRAMEAME